jgi:hypothetical protein
MSQLLSFQSTTSTFLLMTYWAKNLHYYLCVVNVTIITQNDAKKSMDILIFWKVRKKPDMQ